MNDISNKFDATPVDYNKVASQILTLKPRALTPPQFEDVITLIEWMHGEVVAQHNANTKRAAELNEQAAALEKREREVAIRARTLNVATKFKSPRRYFWR